MSRRIHPTKRPWFWFYCTRCYRAFKRRAVLINKQAQIRTRPILCSDCTQLLYPRRSSP